MPGVSCRIPGAGEREETRRGEPFPNHRQLSFASYETTERKGQIAANKTCAFEGAPSGARPKQTRIPLV